MGDYRGIVIHYYIGDSNLEINHSYLEELVIITTRRTCSNMTTRYDDEYLSYAFEIAWDCILRYDPTLTKRTVYEYVKYWIYKRLRDYINRENRRGRKIASVDCDTLHGVIDAKLTEPIEDAKQRECYAELVNLNRVRTQRGSGRKRTAQTAELLDRLRRKYKQ